MKICIKCQKEKNEDYFIKSDTICKTCLRKEIKFNKSCNKCKEIKPIVKYSINKKICDDCHQKEKDELLSGQRLCSKCSEFKPLNRFRKYVCFDCSNNDRKRRIKEGKSKLYPNSKENRKKWREKNIEKIRLYRNNYSKNKYKTDIDHKLSVVCRSFLRRCLYDKNGKRTYDILGYSAQKLRQRLECQFTKEMNWNNYGTYWNIDHRKPINMFKLETPIYVINCLSNLRPIVKEENYSKQNRFIS